MCSLRAVDGMRRSGIKGDLCYGIGRFVTMELVDANTVLGGSQDKGMGLEFVIIMSFSTTSSLNSHHTSHSLHLYHMSQR